VQIYIYYILIITTRELSESGFQDETGERERERERDT
jgi:hypothetical protein